ncbi:TetR/AcrR family transcriptional regulator [Actinomycetes bacterium KLBMP 9759]
MTEATDVVTALWGGRGRPSRGPKPAMSVERIAAAAIALADAEGLDAVSMQRLAGELGFTKMALYRYVRGKAELVAIMTDLAIGEAPQLDVTAGWRQQLEQLAHALFAVFRRHPWLLVTTVGQRVLGPRELGWTECALAALTTTGLTGAERLDSVAVLAGHVRVIAEQSRDGDTPEAAMGEGLTSVMREHGDRFPALAAALADTTARGGQDNALDFGLHRILDGVEAHMSR